MALSACVECMLLSACCCMMVDILIFVHAFCQVYDLMSV